MSSVSGASTDFDFWEFVNCGVCHLEFVKESGALSSMPFWLSECGHVICNAHINADQSCAACGSPGIQLLPLQREMEPPMSNWFNSVPNAFDTVAYALRFQMSNMATLVRYFKKKYQQYRPLYERLKAEHAETKRLRKLVDDLKEENLQLRQRLQMNGNDGPDILNVNHKRMRMDDDGYFSGQRSSSPRSTRSAATPVGPDRLTLPPGHHQPQFNSRQSLQMPDSRPPDKQSLEHYAYVPPQSAQATAIAVLSLTHAQSGSTRRAQVRGGDPQQNHAPAPLPAGRLGQRASMDPRRRMPPPPTPQPVTGSRQLPERPSFLPATPQLPSGGSKRFVPQTPMKATAIAPPPTPHAFIPEPYYVQQQNSQTQRFMPTNSAQRLPGVVSSSSGTIARSSSVAQTPTRAGSFAVSTIGGQRTPFVPGAEGRFS